ncbi:MAG TPA: hypothetical protein VF541_06950, partial [Longimicrobium sp.]
MLARVHWFGRRHPEWWVMAMAAAAWVLVAWPGSAHGTPTARSAAVMVMAMMLPMTFADVRVVARASRGERRQ